MNCKSSTSWLVDGIYPIWTWSEILIQDFIVALSLNLITIWWLSNCVQNYPSPILYGTSVAAFQNQDDELDVTLLEDCCSTGKKATIDVVRENGIPVRFWSNVGIWSILTIKIVHEQFVPTPTYWTILSLSIVTFRRHLGIQPFRFVPSITITISFGCSASILYHGVTSSVSSALASIHRLQEWPNCIWIRSHDIWPILAEAFISII